jgi:hypothetical protein
MPKTQRFMIACLALLLGIGIGISLQKLFSLPPVKENVQVSHSVVAVDSQVVVDAMKEMLEERMIPVDGINPFLLIEQFPSTEASDFDGAEAIQGTYTLRDSVLVYNEAMIDTVAVADLTEEGLMTFVEQYAARNNLTTTEAVVAALENVPAEVDTGDTSTSTDSFVACTMDAKMCPDGSYVGRVGPTCEFAACPSGEAPISEPIVCSPEQKSAEMCAEIYQPVCAAVQIQCVTTPCEPIPKTFGNACQACAETSVTEYTEGACLGDATAF